jgi:hypothetical protein
MEPWAVFVAGIAVGWLIEWIIDWVFWRRNVRAFYANEAELKRQLQARDAQIQALQAELAQAAAAPSPANAPRPPG